VSDDVPADAPRVRDRQVVLVAAAVVAVVLGLQLLSAFVPAIGDVLGLAPVLIGALIVITLVVLVRALRPRP
jgi:polyferredoxin